MDTNLLIALLATAVSIITFVITVLAERRLRGARTTAAPKLPQHLRSSVGPRSRSLKATVDDSLIVARDGVYFAIRTPLVSPEDQKTVIMMNPPFASVVGKDIDPSTIDFSSWTKPVFDSIRRSNTIKLGNDNPNVEAVPSSMSLATV
jgi:hypothetical protein